MLEAAAGASYFEELERRILVPLELEQTVPAVPEVAFRAAGYMAMDNDFGLPRKTVQDGVMVFNPEVEWTGGGLTTNPADLVKWARELYEGRAFDGDYLDELIGSGVPTGPDGSSAYGLGVRIRDTEFGPSYGDSGWFPGYRSAMWYYPDHGVAVAFQTNTDVDVDLDAWLPELTSTLLRAVTAPRPRTP